jgi:hypothetical protein
MPEFNLNIPDFTNLNITYSEEVITNYINISIKIEDDCELNFMNQGSPFSDNFEKNVMASDTKFKEIRLYLRYNDKINKDLEYLFMDNDLLIEYCGTITPLQYKIKLIKSLILFDD